MEIINSFHFLRPWWLLCMPLWLFITYHLQHARQQHNGWSALCDPALLTYLVGGDTAQSQKGSAKIWLSAIMTAGVMASIALAGPVWKQLPQPVFQAASGMVLILDLSRSMDAEDVKPSRLMRAKQKMQDILAARKEGQTGLIVFAGSAFDVVPLTTDNKAILSLLSSLDTSMMPAQGSLASLALKRAAAMLQRGAIQGGSVVMLCDGVDADAVAAAQSLAKAGHSVSILAVGTSDGAPIPLAPTDQGSGGFMKDHSGNIILPRLDKNSLTAVTAAGDGLFQYIRLDDLDVMRLPGLIPSHFNADATQDKALHHMQTDQWHEEGPWLVLLLLPLCVLAFRRGVLLALLLIPAVSILAFPSTSQAMTWTNLWQTPDQQAQVFMQQDKAKEAAKLFKDPAWQAAAHYRAGEFDKAAQALANSPESDNQYNKANALARAGKLQEALKAYDNALKNQHSSNTDAQFNRDLVAKALKKQQQKKNKSKSKPENNKKDDHKKSDKKSGNKSDHNSNKPQQSKQQNNKDKQGQALDKPGSANKKGQSKQDKNKTNPAKQQQTDHQKENKQKMHKQKANKQKANKQKAEQQKKDQHKAAKETAANTAKSQAAEQQSLEKLRAQQQMLRRIPDDPGGLLRRKFKYQYQNQQQQSGSQQAW